MRRCVLIGLDETQRGRLTAAARSRSWQVGKVLAVGARSSRDAFEELREAARAGTVDAVVLETVIWPGDDVAGALRRLDSMVQLQMAVLSVNEPWLDSSAHPLLHWVVERLDEEHRNRVRAALARARAEGRRLGRPPAVIPADRVLELRGRGASLRAIAREVGLGVSTIQRFLKSKGERVP